jgi:hypothetical protein
VVASGTPAEIAAASMPGPSVEATGDSGGPAGAPQIPPLRCASVGMTKGRVALPFRFDIADDEQQVPPLRSASLT